MTRATPWTCCASLFLTFPLKPSDQSAFLAYLISMLVRDAILGSVPLAAFQAHTPWSGKGLLANAAWAIAMGRFAALMLAV
jgi:hypothetical protein